MTYTNSVWKAPNALSLPITDSENSPTTSGWSGGLHSFVTAGALHNRALSFSNNHTFASKNWNFSSFTIPVTPGRLYVFKYKMYSNEQYPPVMAVRISQLDSSYTTKDTHVSRSGTGAYKQWKTCLVPFQVRQDSNITQVSISIGRFFNNALRGSTGSVLVDEIEVYDYGQDYQAGNVWLNEPPKTRRPFNSGNGEITISSTGAWKLNGQPFVIKSIYPDDAGVGPAASAARGLSQGFNTVYQANPMAGQLIWAPNGMYTSADVTSACIPTGGWYRNWTALENAVENVVNNYPNVISWYMDVENDAWEALHDAEELCRRIRAKESAMGSYHRPIIAHCQHLGGAERLDHLVDVFEWKNNPCSSDFGTTHPNTNHVDPNKRSYYDSLQGSMGYVVHSHPDITIPAAQAIFNVPHLGSNLGVWLIDTVIKGGTGYGTWADRSTDSIWGFNIGFPNQPWWNGAIDDHNKFEAIYPMMTASPTNIYTATFSSGANDGAIGVTKTLRKVGDEIWAAFANKGPSTKSFTVDLEDEYNTWVERWAENGGSVVQNSSTRFTVTLPAYSGHVASFKLGNYVPQEYSLNISSPTRGTLVNPTAITEGTNSVVYGVYLDNYTNVATQHLKFFKVVGETETEVNYQIISDVGNILTVTPSIEYVEDDLIKVEYWIEDYANNVLETAVDSYYLVVAEDTGGGGPTPDPVTVFTDKIIVLDPPEFINYLDFKGNDYWAEGWKLSGLVTPGGLDETAGIVGYNFTQQRLYFRPNEGWTGEFTIKPRITHPTEPDKLADITVKVNSGFYVGTGGNTGGAARETVWVIRDDGAKVVEWKA